MPEGKKEIHPSYALLSFSRQSRGGSGATLFGSSIKHKLARIFIYMSVSI